MSLFSELDTEIDFCEINFWEAYKEYIKIWCKTVYITNYQFAFKSCKSVISIPLIIRTDFKTVYTDDYRKLRIKIGAIIYQSRNTLTLKYKH